jgi:hypothetical protein
VVLTAGAGLALVAKQREVEVDVDVGDAARAGKSRVAGTSGCD